MRFVVDRDVLNDVVTWTSRAVPHRPPTPVLAGIRIDADRSGSVKMSSFDYEISAKGEIEASVTAEGTALVSGRLLKEIVNALPSKPIDFSLEGTKVVVVSGTSRFALATMPVDQYPNLPDFPNQSGTVDGSVFLQSVTQVSSAASKDETLPILTGIRMEVEGSTISLLATDRYRLALREMIWTPIEENISSVALVRSRMLVESAKALGSGDINVALSMDSDVKLVGFSSGSLITTSLLMDGEYPPVRRLFPESTPITAVVKTEDIIDATRRVSLVTERNSSVRLTFSDGEVVLDAGQTEDAQASESLEASVDGGSIAVAFNPHYLLDGLTAMMTDYVRFGFTQETKPVEFVGMDKPGGSASAQFRYLLVPIRISS